MWKLQDFKWQQLKKKQNKQTKTAAKYFGKWDLEISLSGIQISAGVILFSFKPENI